MATAKSFLHSHPELVEAGGRSVGPGRGRPATIWRLTEAGESRLRSELRRLSLDEGAFDDEEAASVRAIEAAAEAVLREISDLSRLNAMWDREEWRVREPRVRRRIAVTHKAISYLKDKGRTAVHQAALENARAELDQLCYQRWSPSPHSDRLRAALSVYLTQWLRDLAARLRGITPTATLEMPYRLTAAPIILLSGGEGSDELTLARVRRLATETGAPLVETQLDPNRHDSQLFGFLADHLQYAAGAATRLVLTIDSDRDECEPFASSFAALAGLRAGPIGKDFTGPYERSAHRILSLAGESLFAAGRAAASGFSQLLPPAALMIFGALSRQDEEFEPAADRPALTQLPPFCFDTSEAMRFSEILIDGGVISLSQRALESGAAVLPQPLSLGPHTPEPVWTDHSLVGADAVEWQTVGT
jgi:hypothetical protein